MSSLVAALLRKSSVQKIGRNSADWHLGEDRLFDFELSRSKTENFFLYVRGFFSRQQPPLSPVIGQLTQGIIKD